MNALQLVAHIAGNLPPRRVTALLCLGGLALLLVGLVAASAQSTHAQGQTTIWSATLTVSEQGEYHGCDDAGPSEVDDCPTALTDDDFAYGDVTYEVEALYWDSDLDELFLRFVLPIDGSDAKPALGSLTLNVDGVALAFKDVNVEDPDVYWPFDPDTDWTGGQKVSLSLTEPAPEPTATPTPVPAEPVDEEPEPTPSLLPRRRRHPRPNLRLRPRRHARRFLPNRLTRRRNLRRRPLPRPRRRRHPRRFLPNRLTSRQNRRPTPALPPSPARRRWARPLRPPSTAWATFPTATSGWRTTWRSPERPARPTWFERRTRARPSRYGWTSPTVTAMRSR